MKIYFSYLSTKTYVVGTQKNRLNDFCILSLDVASGSDIMPCFKIDKTASGLHIV